MFVRLSGKLFNIQIATILGVAICSIGAIWGAVILTETIYPTVMSWYRERPWYEKIDSKVYSLYYEYRVKLLDRLGVLN